MKLVKSIVVSGLFFSVAAFAAKENICHNQAKITKAAEKIFDREDEARGDDPIYVKTAGGQDIWKVSIVHNDQCYSDVGVYMKAGTCTVEKVKKGHETCTDD